MKITYWRSLKVAALYGSVALPALIFSHPVFAQSTAVLPGPETVAPANDVSAADIVVTGTLIRGKAPTGGQLVTLGSADIAQLGVSDTSQLLGSLPQDSSFNNRPQVGGFGQYQTVNAPLLRYLGGNASGSSSTLLLLDGIRMPGMGVFQTIPDIDAVAPGALERVDAVADGGSATYGSDAVGGVVNLISRKRFDGLEVGGHYGGADAYRQWDVNATVGKKWSNGSAWVSYAYAQHDLIYGSDRDYVKNLNYTTTPYTPNSLSCNPGNYTAGGLVFTNTPPYYAILPVVNYPIANGVPTVGAANTCDISQKSAFFPGEKRHSVMAGFDVDLSDTINVNIRGFYMHRDSLGDGGPLAYSNIAASYPGFPNGNVSGNMSPSFGEHSYARTTLDTFRIVPQITAQLGHDWQLVAFFNYGEGSSTFTAPSLDLNALSAQAASGSFNPFTGTFANTAAGAAAKAYQGNYIGLSSGRDDILNARAVLDGPLFALPGGDVRAAVGVEILQENFTQRNGTASASNLGSILPNKADRVVKSAFGELSVPIVGEANRGTGFYSLTLSAAGRYDHYSDFGGTFNPKVGLIWNPTRWWTLRGNWGKSFQAPSLASTADAIPPGLIAIPASTFGGNPAFPDTTGKSIILLYPGGGLNLKPQKATTWEIGTDFKPDAFPGFSASLTYYNINFKDRISAPAFYTNSFYSLYPNSYVMNTAANPLTPAQIQQYVSSVSPSLQAQANIAQFLTPAGAANVYALENGLTQNLATLKTSGLDFNVNYQHPTSFGSVFGGVAGTYILTYDTKATPTSSFQGLADNNVSRLRTATSLGVKVGDFLAKATWNVTGKFAVASNAGDAFQSEVKAFSVFNLAFQYALTGDGPLKDVSINLNVDNVFDTNPPAYNGSFGSGAGFAGFTLGRYIGMGVKKKF